MDNIEKSFSSYQEWKDYLSSLSDAEVSEEIKKRILSESGMNQEEQNIFNDIYNFFKKNTIAGKPVKIDLLKIYLEDIKGYDVKKINIYQMLILLSFCGIQFK